MNATFLGTTLRRWLEYLIAILLGNAIYYFSLQPHLPPIWRHPGAKIDLGLFLDFLVCVGVYGLIRLGVYSSDGAMTMAPQMLKEEWVERTAGAPPALTTPKFGGGNNCGRSLDSTNDWIWLG
jgi:hypothetical protein